MDALFYASIYSSIYHELHEYIAYVVKLEKERDEY